MIWQPLELHAFMQSDDAAGHIVVIHCIEAGVKHHLREGFLIGVHADGFGQILIAFRIFGDEFTHQWQQLEGLNVVYWRARFVDFGKFEYYYGAAVF